ncbi:hypothetical protein ACFVVA_13010 [Kitasatospora sp. NPDC058048]|uniref:hypothetical protein n=1 Tax=Kitasatospora sp. NPDC058048 TaxID=3346313 RepID=UPI0036DD8863
MNRLPQEEPAPDPPAALLTAGLREVAARIRDSADPAEVAGLLQEITRDGGTLEAVSDVVATASRWTKARPGGAYLWQPLGRAADEIWEAGADVTDLPAQIRGLTAGPARIRSAAARTTTHAPGADRVQAPPAPTAHPLTPEPHRSRGR